MQNTDIAGAVMSALCACYRAGADGEECPVRLDFKAELETLSGKTGRPLEQLKANRGLWRLFILARKAYDMGVKSKSQERWSA